MMTTTPEDHAAPHAAPESIPDTRNVLERVELGTLAEQVTLCSGRRYELEAGETTDSITVRSASGRVLLRVAVSDDGPLLSFESAEVTLSARKRLALRAPEIDIEAGDVSIETGTLEETVYANRYTHVYGEDRLEAGVISTQTNEGAYVVRAMGKIALDGEHIGLNDDPCPAPLPWSTLSEQEGDVP